MPPAASYTPVTDFLGVLRFAFTITDGWGGVAEAFVFMGVHPGNAATLNIVSVIGGRGAHNRKSNLRRLKPKLQTGALKSALRRGKGSSGTRAPAASNNRGCPR